MKFINKKSYEGRVSRKFYLTNSFVRKGLDIQGEYRLTTEEWLEVMYQ